MTDANNTADTAENTGDSQAGIQLVPQDLNMYANIIKVAAERGAFKAEEYSQVGAAYDKLVAFLKQIAPPAPEGEGDADEGNSTAESENKEASE